MHTSTIRDNHHSVGVGVGVYSMYFGIVLASCCVLLFQFQLTVVLVEALVPEPSATGSPDDGNNSYNDNGNNDLQSVDVYDYLYDNPESYPVVEHILVDNPQSDRWMELAKPNFVLDVSWPRVIQFYFPNDTDCINFQSSYIHVAKQFRKRSKYAPVGFYAVSCAVHKELCSDYGILEDVSSSNQKLPHLVGLPAGNTEGVLLLTNTNTNNTNNGNHQNHNNGNHHPQQQQLDVDYVSDSIGVILIPDADQQQQQHYNNNDNTNTNTNNNNNEDVASVVQQQHDLLNTLDKNNDNDLQHNMDNNNMMDNPEQMYEQQQQKQQQWQQQRQRDQDQQRRNHNHNNGHHHNNHHDAEYQEEMNDFGGNIHHSEAQQLDYADAFLALRYTLEHLVHLNEDANVKNTDEDENENDDSTDTDTTDTDTNNVDTDNVNHLERSLALMEFMDLLHWSLPSYWNVHNLVNDLRNDMGVMTEGRGSGGRRSSARSSSSSSSSLTIAVTVPSQTDLLAVLRRHPPPRDEWSDSCASSTKNDNNNDNSGDNEDGTSGNDNNNNDIDITNSPAYLCGIWKLLHIITLGVHEQHARVLGDMDRVSMTHVATTLRGFIRHYLSVACAECEDTFGKLYDGDNGNNKDNGNGNHKQNKNCAFDRCTRLVVPPTSSGGGMLGYTTAVSPDQRRKAWRQLALWLWEVHNHIHEQIITVEAEAKSSLGIHMDLKELRDETQWPSRTSCPQCWVNTNANTNANADAVWKHDENQVFLYLKQAYWYVRTYVFTSISPYIHECTM
jgi:hypothetical protein